MIEHDLRGVGLCLGQHAVGCYSFKSRRTLEKRSEFIGLWASANVFNGAFEC